MRQTRDRQKVAGALLALCLLAPAIAAPQEPGEDLAGRLIERVVFEGATQVREDALRDRLETRPTRCRGILLSPVCWIHEWDVVAERHHFDPEALPRDELRVRVMYFRAGYRDTGVSSEVRERGDRVEVAFRVQEGPATIVESLDLRQTEEVLGEEEVDRAALPEEGAPLDLDRLELAIDTLSELVARRGFLDAVVRDSIAADEQRATVRVVLDPGPRSTLAGFDVSGNEDIERETLLRGIAMEEGDVLTRTLVESAARTLHQSNLFHEVRVTVPDRPDSTKVVQIQVREAPPRLARIGGGLNTLEFAQLEGRFTHYNWLGSGRRLDLRANAGNLFAPWLNDFGFFQDILPGDLSGVDESPFERPTWQVSAEFQQPHFRRAEDVLGLSVFAHRRIVPAVSVDLGYGGDVSYTRRFLFGVPASLTYRYEVTSVRAGDIFFCVNFGICDPSIIDNIRGYSVLSPLTLDMHVERIDDPLAATEGYRARLDFEHASGTTLSEFRYNRVSGGASYYWPIGGPRPHVLAANLRVGWVEALEGTRGALGAPEGDRNLIHPRKRFYAGGARSVRGYQENQLGPRVLTIPREALVGEGLCTPEEIADRTCDPNVAPVDAFFPRPLGGTAVAEASVEYRFPVGTVTGAVFVDGALVGGRLAGLLQDATRAVTPGFGVRFDSPAGPIRIDLGIRGRTVQRLPVVTELESEPMDGVIDRELVQLEERRRYDPLEGQDTLGRILGRFTLHFSIGEAF